MQKTRLPRLEIVSLRSLILHEDVEQHRVERIGRRLRKEGILKNPPIVGRNPRHRKLIVLDGASRVTAARQLGLPHLLVQMVSYPSSEIGLDPWHHLVVGMSWRTLLEKAAAIPGVSVEIVSWTKASRDLNRRRLFACLRSPGKQSAGLRLTHPRKTGLRPVRELTRLYATDPGLHRIREDQIDLPHHWLGKEYVMVLFSRLRQEDILRFALGNRDRLPMGITRHTVPNRALRVLYPISRLRSGLSLARKRAQLERFLEKKWEAGAIRSYPEPTTLYDE